MSDSGAFAVWGTGPDEVFAVGGGNTILRYDGSTWSEMECADGYDADLDEYAFHLDVWGSSGTDVFTVGEGPGDANVYHYDGDEWSAMETPEPWRLLAVWGSASDDVYAVGDYQFAFHFDGETWDYLDLPVIEDVEYVDVWGSGQNDVFVLCNIELGYKNDEAAILHYDGESWSEMLVDETWCAPNAIAGSGPANVFVTFQECSSDLVAHYNGEYWSSFLVHDNYDGELGELDHLGKLWVASPDLLFLFEQSVGVGVVEAGVWRYESGDWSLDFLHDDGQEDGFDARDIWGSSGDDVFMVGGKIWHYGC